SARATSSPACARACGCSGGTRAPTRRAHACAAARTSGPASRARRTPPAGARVEADGSYVVQIAASDIGQGGRTVLTQIAADALDVPIERVRVEIGDSSLPFASLAGGSMGTASWGTAVVR